MNVAMETTARIKRPATKEHNRLESWREITNAWKMIMKGAEKNISSLGMCTTDFKILRILHDEGPTPMARLSDATILTQPAITSFVDKLESQDLVRRTRDQKDRRVIRIDITAKGETVFRQGLRVHTKFVDGLLSGISEAELMKLSVIMNKLSKEISEK